MSEVVTAQAKRLRAPSWRDSRLLGGLFLVLLATTLGGWIVARADRTVPVYAAAGPLVPGQRLAADDVRRVDVRLGDGAAAYLSAAQPLPVGAHIGRGFAEGELIPASAVVDAAAVSTRLVAVPVDATAITLLARGTIVDVFVNRPTGATAGGKTVYAGPELLLPGVTVAAVPEAGSVLGTSVTRRTVHLVVPEEKVKTLVADMDLEARITLVPTPGNGAGGASATTGGGP